MGFTNKKLAYLEIILAMIIWGSVGILARLIPFSSKIIVFYRVLFAFISLSLYTFLKGEYNIDIEDNKIYVIIATGFFLALNWLFFFKAIKTTTIAAATISYYTSPIILSFLAVFLLKEKMNLKVIISLISSFIGLILIISTNGIDTVSPRLIGIFYGLTAAFFYALFSVTNKMIKAVSSLKLTLIQSGIATLIFIPFILPLEIPDIKSLLLLIFMGVFHTAFALILYLDGLSKVKAHNVGILSYIDPLSAVILAALFFNEIPGYMTIIGAIFILASGYISVKGN